MTWKQDPEYRRQYYLKNKERQDANAKAWRDKNRDRYNSRIQKWREENREKLDSPENRAKKSEYNREYARNNRERLRDRNRRRRALKLGAKHVPYTTQDVIDQYGLICHWCGKNIDRTAPRHNSGLPGWELSLHIDHVIELVNGGSDTIENVRPACAKCNLRRPWKR